MKDMILYLTTILIWGSTWIAITFQLGDVDPMVSVIYRFGLASAILLVFCKIRGFALSFSLKDHFFLALFGSVVAFGTYLTLVGRMGADKAAYAIMVVPVVALGISSVVEGYVWTLPAVFGLILVVSGNFLALGRRPG